MPAPINAPTVMMIVSKTGVEIGAEDRSCARNIEARYAIAPSKPDPPQTTVTARQRSQDRCGIGAANNGGGGDVGGGGADSSIE
jgi:hypothetical protein